MTENTANYGSEKKDGGYEFGGPVGIESWLYLYLAKVKDFKKINSSLLWLLTRNHFALIQVQEP